MSCPLISLFAFIALSIAAFGLGRPLLRWIGVADDDRLAMVAFSIGLGLTVAGTALLLLGLAGALYLPLLGVLTMLCCCWGLVEIGLVWFRIKEPLPAEFLPPADPWEPPGEWPWPVPRRWLLIVVWTAAALVCAAALVNALAPPTTTATLSCQLESAKRFLVDHRLARLPAADLATRPLLVDMWYLWALVFDSGVCARLVHWGLGILLLLATVVLATPLVGRPWAWVAGGLVVLTPAINQQMSLPAESVALAAFCTLALAAWSQAALDGGTPRWFFVAGLMAGGAVGVHYAAALMAPALAAAWAWSALRRRERHRRLLRGGAIAILVAIGIGVLCRLLSLGPAAKSACLAALPDHLGAVLLAAAPGLLLVRRLRGLGTLLLAALLYAALSFSLGGDARLLFPAVPVLSVGAVWVWIELPRFSPVAQRIGAAALAVTIACSIALSLLRSPDALAVALGLEDQEEYLLRREPTYVAATIANHALRNNARLLSQERQAFYFDCPVTWENSLGSAIRGKASALSVQETVRRLRRAGFTHLLVTETAPAEPWPAVSLLRRVADATPTLADYSFRTADGSVRHYRLVMLR